MTNSDAHFENSVNAQGLFFAVYSVSSPVAKTANPAYCWGALKEQRTDPAANRKAISTKTKIGYK